MRAIRVAVAGLGFVGRETVKLLAANRERFQERLGAPIELVAVADRDAVREARALKLPKSVARRKDPLELLAFPGVDAVVELLGGLEAPRRLALGTLRSGRHLVTANKRLLAYCWDELRGAAHAGGGRLYFEGSVAGGIPLLQALDSSFAANRIEAVYGILNGTTNYILSRAESGISPEAALAEAQRLGFAEKDPSTDLSGRDTAQKVSVLGALLTGRALKPESIHCEGIERIGSEDIDFAFSTLRRTPKLIGSLRLDWTQDGGSVSVEAHVFPTLVPLEHPLAAVRREYNAVFVKASSAADLMFYGKGAGPGPTASAVVGDLFMLARDLLGGLPARRSPALRAKASSVDESEAPYYLRLHAEDRPGVLARIASTLAERSISIATIHQSERKNAKGVPIVLTTHPIRHGAFRAALRRALALPSVSRRFTAMRMLP